MTHEPLTENDLAGFWQTTIEPWSYDFDYLGHMTAAVYGKAFEEGRFRYFKDRWQTKFPTYVVAHNTMHFRKEVLQEVTPIHILSRPIELGESRMFFEELLLDSKMRICNVSTVTLVAWDIERRRSRPLTNAERIPLENDIRNLKGLVSREL